MVFGVFDGLHNGHRHFFREAKKRCERLIVVVAVPEMVSNLKHRLPKYTLEERMAALRAFDPTTTIVPSDAVPGTWSALRKHQPDIVFLGHDQTALGEALEQIKIRTVSIGAHHPTVFKSSLLNHHFPD